jgi:hypothetical protein
MVNRRTFALGAIDRAGVPVQLALAGRAVAPTGSRQPLRRRLHRDPQPGKGLSRREAGYRLGSDRGSPNHGSTLLSKRVMAQIRSSARVRT